MSSYTYSIADDLGGNYDPLVLYDTISGTIHTSENDPICTGLKKVDSNANVEVHFTKTLTGGQVTTLNGIISGYVYASPYTKTNYHSFQLRKSETDSKTWEVIGSAVYPGCVNTSDIFEIEFETYVDSGNTSYDVRIIDRDTNTIIAEDSFSNTSTQRNSLNTILHCPTSLSTLQLAVKVNSTGNSKKKVYINDVVVWII